MLARRGVIVSDHQLSRAPAKIRTSGVDRTGLLSGAIIGTTVMTTITEAAQARHITRMSLPVVLGTLATERRPLVRVSGTLLHFLNGIVFASGYALFFERARRADWRLGAGIGALHGLAVLVVLLPIIQEVHPRMAQEDEGPDPTPLLEPPGFLAMHYGIQTPTVTIAAHLVYGGIIGALYRPGGEVGQ